MGGAGLLWAELGYCGRSWVIVGGAGLLWAELGYCGRNWISHGGVSCRSVAVETGGLAPTPRVPGGTPAQSRSDSHELQCLKQAFALFCEHKQVTMVTVAL